MADLDRTDSAVVCLLELDGAVPDVFSYTLKCEHKPNGESSGCLPSISFQAFKKSSGSEKATNPYLACNRDVNILRGSKRHGAHLLTESVANHTSLREGCVLVEGVC
jgi:hypothetical protein